jgi:hypothetical protein
MSGKLTVYRDFKKSFPSEPIKKHENASHPITMLEYGVTRYRKYHTHKKLNLLYC